MSPETNNSRRRFLAVALGAVIVTILRPYWAWASSAEQQLSCPPELRLVGLLKHRESARRIGSAYLGNSPGEASTRNLANLIVSDIANRPQDLDKASPADLRERIRWRTRQDFEDGRVVKLHGWLVSVTEVRLCALSVLVHPGPG